MAETKKTREDFFETLSGLTMSEKIRDTFLVIKMFQNDCFANKMNPTGFPVRFGVLRLHVRTAGLIFRSHFYPDTGSEPF